LQVYHTQYDVANAGQPNTYDLLLLLLLMPLLLLQMSQLRRDFAASSQSNVTWQVLGNTVVMGPLNTPDVESAAQEQGFLAQTLLSVSFELLILWIGESCLHSRSSRASWPRRCYELAVSACLQHQLHSRS
jgi:hypothetical protein